MHSAPGAPVFVSYRRSDSQGFAGRLADDLIETFGAAQVFRDDDIPEGNDFTESLNAALAACRVLIVVIGPQWLNATNANGARRLDDPHDWVRREIAAAFERDVWVLPVLVAAAPMPAAHNLPADIAPLSRVQAVCMADRGWDDDMRRLEELLARRIPELRSVPARGARARGLSATPRELIRHYGELLARRVDTTALRVPPSRGERIFGTVVRGVKGLLLLGLACLVAWFWLENYASPGVRRTVAEFIEFVRAKANCGLRCA